MENKYLLLARRAREEDNSEDAKKYYDMVRTEDPDNAEAKFFYSYYKLMSGTKGHAYSDYVTFCNGIEPTLSMVMASNESYEDKKALVKSIVECADIAYEVTRSADIDIRGGNGNSIIIKNQLTMLSLIDCIVKNFGSDSEMLCVAYRSRKSAITYSEEKRPLDMYKLGDEIEKIFPKDNDLMAIAVSCWKEGVEYQQKYYGYVKDKSVPEGYAEKIKKYEPNYEMPKRPGCISSGS